MIDKITQVYFKSDQDYRYGIKGLEQWDKGQKLEISGLNISDEIVEVHFSLQENQGEAKRMLATVENGIIYADIPAFILEGPEYIYGNADTYSAYAWIYLSDEESAETIRKMEFEIKARPRPAEYVTPEELSFLEQLRVELEKLKQSTGASDEQIAEAVQAYLTENPINETDPTVPEWAKQPTKPSYTASEVGAEESGKVSEHNVSENAHNDIRLLINSLSNQVTALLDSDDETLNQTSEIVAYIKSNKSLIDAITTSKVSVTDIVDNLITSVSNKPLSAKQGVVLKGLIDEVKTALEGIKIPTQLPNPNALTFTGAVEETYDGSEAKTIKIPSGGSGEWKKVVEIQTVEDLTSLTVTEDIEGNPLSFDEALVVFNTARASESTTNGNFVISVSPEWYNSFNSYGIHGFPLNADVYSCVAHFQKIDNLILEEGCAKRILSSIDQLTTWTESVTFTGTNATGYASGSLNFKGMRSRYRKDNDFFNSENKMQGITIGTDLSTSVKIAKDSRLEVWVR